MVFKILGGFLRLLFGILGLCWLSMGIYAVVDSARLVSSGRHASGVVTKVDDESDSDANWHVAHVTYAAAGRTYEILGTTALRGFSRGERVGVVYPPATAAAGRIDTFGQLWGDGVYYGLGGLISLTWALAPLLRRRRSTPGPDAIQGG